MAPSRATKLAIMWGLAGLIGCARPGPESSPSADSTAVSPQEAGSYLHVVVPSVVERNEALALRLRVITQGGIPDYDARTDLRLRVETSDSAIFPTDGLQITPTPEGAYAGGGLKLPRTGVQRIRVSVADDTVAALANPVNVVESAQWRVFWGDLHGHSDLSSGSRSPAVYWWYARSVGLLDFAALTDNDHWGAKTLDDAAFAHAADVTKEFDVPGEFVPILAFEWTSPNDGHRVALFSEQPARLPSFASGVDSPAKLRAALPPGSLLLLINPSGSALNPATNPALAGSGQEDLVEIYSALGSFERAGTHRSSTQETGGAFVTDLLSSAFRPGFVAAGDSRLTTPGNPRVLPHGDQVYLGGLTAVLAKELTRAAVLDALRARRCYATTGPRFLLEFTVDGAVMGSEVQVSRGHVADIYGSLGSTTQWTRVEIVGPEGALGVLTPAAGSADVVELTAKTPPVTSPTWFYLRGVDENGDMAWSSPVYLSPK